MENKNIIFYRRYGDDLLIIYNSKNITADNILEYVNSIHPSLTFTPTHEQDKIISFLDLLITKQRTTLDTDIYRKPTATDTNINYQSNHPLEHKMAAYRFLINRMNSLPQWNNNKKKEWDTIKTIAENNKFPLLKINKLYNNLVKQQKNNKTDKENQKWAIFTSKYSPFTCKYSNRKRIKQIKKTKNGLYLHVNIALFFFSLSLVSFFFCFTKLL